MGQRDFGLMGDEEATGTRVLPVAEGQMIHTCADQVRLVGAATGLIAHTLKSKPVELRRVLVNAGAPHAISGHPDNTSLG